jgi:hypothetical protein
MMRPRFLMLLGFAVICIGMVILLVQRKGAPLFPSLPDSNGYDDLLAAGGMLPQIDPDAPAPVLRNLLNENAAALHLARAALEKECQVPLEFSAEWMEQHLGNLRVFKSLAQGFAAEGSIAQLDERWEDAAGSYFDAIRLGHQISRGGLLIDKLVGIACETMGISRLENVVASLEADQSRMLARALHELDLHQEDLGTIMRRDRAWAQQTMGHTYRLISTVTRMIQSRSSNPLAAAFSNAELKMKRLDHRRLSLAVQLATRAFELEKGVLPSNIEALAPEYLPSVPIQPASGQEFSLNP